MPNKLKTIFPISIAVAVLFFGVYFALRPVTKNPTEFYAVELPGRYNETLVISALDHIFSIEPLAAAASSPVTANNIVKYIDAYRNTDVVQTRYSNRIKEDIILKQPGHPDKFEYKIDLNLYDFNKDENGNLIFYAKSLPAGRQGKKGDELYRIFTIPAPFMTDSQSKKSDTSAVAMSLTNDGILTIAPDKTWLADAVYPVTLDPTIEINILNIHSHPQQGENWTVEFTTQGRADLKIIPNDQVTIVDDEFVSLWCGGEQRTPQILSGDVIYYPNWECNEVAKVIHYTKKAGRHTLRFEFGGQITYAYNNPGFTFIASVFGENMGSGVTTADTESALDVAAGDLLVAYVEWQDGESGDTVTVAKNSGSPVNNFTCDTADKAVQVSDIGGAFCYLLSAAADPNAVFRFTLSPSGRRLQIWVLQFRPSSGYTVSKDTSNTGTSSGTALQSGNITTTGTDEVVIGGGSQANGGDGFSAFQIGDVNADGSDMDTYFAYWYRILSATASNIHAQATFLGGSDNWVCNIISFKATPPKTVINSPRGLAGSLSSGLVGYWSFNGPDMNWRYNYAYDRSSTHATGTMTNMSTTSSPVEGISGQALKFDGVNDYVNAGTSLDVSSIPFTVSAWVNITQTSGYGGILSKRDGWTANNMRFSFQLELPDEIELTQPNSSRQITYAIPRNEWHMLTVVANISSTDFYVNGSFIDSSSAFTLGTDASAAVIIGDTQIDQSDPLNGSIDEVRVYNRALSESEITNLYQAGASRMKINSPASAPGGNSGLVGYWSFNGPDMNWRYNSAYDRSSSHATGTMTNMSTTSSPIEGISGQALSFDGIDDEIDLSSDIIGTGADSITAWIYVRGCAFNDGCGIVSNDKTVFYIHTVYDRLIFASDFYTTIDSGNGSFADLYNEWVFVSATREANGYATIYINGEAAVDGSSGTPVAGGNVQIGISWSTVEYFNGLIDEVRIYNRVLSASEIQELYTQGARKMKIRQ